MFQNPLGHCHPGKATQSWKGQKRSRHPSIYAIMSYHTGPSKSSIIPGTQKSSVAFIQTNTNYHGKTDAIAKSNAWIQLSSGFYSFNTHLDDGLHDAAPFFHKQTFRIRISIGVTSKARINSVDLTRYKHWLSLSKTYSVPPALKGSPNSIRSAQFWNSESRSCEHNGYRAVVYSHWKLMHTHLISDFRESGGGCSICNVIYCPMHKPGHPYRPRNRPLAFEAGGHYFDRKGDNVDKRQRYSNRSDYKNAHYSSSDDDNSCRYMHQITIHRHNHALYWQAVKVLGSWRLGSTVTSLTTFVLRPCESHGYLPGKPSHIYTGNLTATPDNLRKFIRGTSESNAPSCIIPSEDVEP